MCGLAGLFSKSSSKEQNISKMEAMLESIERRGPDGSGIWTDDKGLVLGHRRLSIIDLSDGGKQPMSLEGRLHITYNGEIYNFIELKKELISKGYSFHSDSDTEVLLQMFLEYGVEKAISKLKGMFAIALVDSSKDELYLIRDRAGEKPLYYGFVDDDFVFASEVQAIKKVYKNLNINFDSVSSFFRHNYIPGPQSIYKEIFKLSPGSLVCLNLSDLQNKNLPEPKTYWALDPAKVSTFEGDFQSAKSKLSSSLDDVISNQMIADVNLGSFLSGGVDSSLVTAVMQKVSSKPVKTFSIGFEESELNEAPYAKDVADHLGTEHTEFYVTSKDCLDWVEKIPDIYTEPFSDSSQIPTSIVSQMAKEQVTVCLSGDGADELFCGYSRYEIAHNLFEKVNSISPFVKNVGAPVISASPAALINSSYNALRLIKSGLPKVKNPKQKMLQVLRGTDDQNFVEFYRRIVSHSNSPDKMLLSGKECRTEFDKRNIYNQEFMTNYDIMMLLDFNSYLPGDILTKVDRAGMYSSLETRIPFLDHEIAELAWSLPLSYKLGSLGTKTILKSLVYDYIPQKIMDRPKSGFGIPIRAWIDVSLKEMVRDLLSKERLKQQGIFNVEVVDQIIENHYKGRVNNEYLIWDLLMFQLWQMKN